MMPRIHIGDQEYPPIYEPLVVAPLLLRDVVFVRLELVGENVSGSVPFWYKTRTYHKHLPVDSAVCIGTLSALP